MDVPSWDPDVEYPQPLTHTPIEAYAQALRRKSEYLVLQRSPCEQQDEQSRSLFGDKSPDDVGLGGEDEPVAEVATSTPGACLGN